MARTNNLTDYLTDVADAIREKKGTTDTIPAASFDEEIKNLPSGGGGDLEEYFNGNYTSVNITGEASGGWRYVLKKLPNITIPSNATSLRYFFAGFKGAEIPYIDTSNISEISNIFEHCLNFERVPELDGSKFTDLRTAFGVYLYQLPNFTDFGGFKNLGKAYLTTASANYSNYTLDLRACVSLTHESLINVINNLYDIASIGVQPQRLQLGSTNKAKLTADEIAIATNKGWSVS